MKNMTKKKNTYYADFIDTSGERIRKSLGKDLAKAQITLTYLMMDVKNPSEEAPDAEKGKVFSAAVDEFISRYYNIDNAWNKKQGQWDRDAERQPQLVTKTLKTFKTQANIHYVAQAGLPQMERFIDAQVKLVKPGTVNKYINFLKAFFKFCEKRDYIIRSKAESLEKLPVHNHPRYQLTPVETKQVLSNAGSFKDFYLFAFNTGLRVSDMYNLTQDDMVVEEGDMFFKRLIGKTKELLLVPVNNQARRIIERADHKIFPSAGEDMWKKALRSNFRSNFEEEYLTEKKITLHTLRHTFAITGLNNGMPKEVIQAYLGHTTVTTTEIYSNQMSKTELLKMLPREIKK